MGGDAEFENVKLSGSTDFMLGYHNVVFDENSKLDVNYNYSGTKSTNTTEGFTVELNGSNSTWYLNFGNNGGTTVHNGPVTFNINQFTNFAAGFNFGKATYNDALNLNLKVVNRAIKFGGAANATFGAKGAFQFINSSGKSLESATAFDSIPAEKKYVLTNNTGNKTFIDFTDEIGKYAITLEEGYYARAVLDSNSNIYYDSVDGLLTIPAGEYTLEIMKTPEYATYYVGADGTAPDDFVFAENCIDQTIYTTVADAITAAVEDGFVKCDEVTIKLLGETLNNGTYPEYKFDLVVEGSTIEVPAEEEGAEPTTKPTRIVMGGSYLANNEGSTTTYKTVELYRAESWNSFYLRSSNAVFESDVIFNHNWLTLAFGVNAAPNYGSKTTAGQSVVYKAKGVHKIELSNSTHSGVTLTKDINLVIDNENTSTQISFNPYYDYNDGNGSVANGTTKYNKNVNINLKSAKGISFVQPDGATINGAIQIINSSAVEINSNSGALANFTCPKYIITNKTADKEIITTTEIAGVYNIAGEKVVRAVNMSTGEYAESAEGVLDITALGAGEYILAFPTDYSAYEGADKYAEYIVDRTALNGNHALNNVAAKINNGEHIDVVYYGGSVTAGAGSTWGDRYSWRGLISTWLEVNAPNSTVTNINSAIGGTGSFFGNYRLQEAVLDKAPDLLFIEFSINDYYENITKTEAARRFESLVHRIRTALPECDIVTVLTTDKSRVQNLKDNDTLHPQAQGHDSIAEVYGIPSLRVGHALADYLSANWTDNDYAEWNALITDIVHPSDEGYKIYYGVVNEFMANSLFDINKDATTVKEHVMPADIVSEELLDGEYTTYEPSEEMAAASVALGYDTLAVETGDSRIKYYDTYFNIQNTTETGFAFEFTNATELAAVLHNDKKALNVKVMRKSDSEVVSDTTSKFNGLGVEVVATGLDPQETYVAVLTGSEWIRLHALITRNAELATKKEYIEYFDNFNDYSTFDEFCNEWESRHSSYNASCELVDGKVKLSPMTGIPNKMCITKNKSISSLNQYISVDVTPEDFYYVHGGAGLYARVSDNHKKFYQLSICNNLVRVTKWIGTTNSSGNYTSTSEGFDFTGLTGRMPNSAETITFNNNHTYRLAMSVVNEGSVAYIRAIVLNLTTGDVMFDETYKDTQPLTDTGVGFAHEGGIDPVNSTVNGPAYFDNFYFSNYKFREGDEGNLEGGINEDSVYDIRDLVRADEAIGEGLYLSNADKDHNGVIEKADLDVIRKEILLGGYTLGEFNRTGNSDAEAAVMRDNILNSTSDIVDNGNGTYTYTSVATIRDAEAAGGFKTETATYERTGKVWYVSATATNGTGTENDPWSLDQMNDFAAKNRSDTTSTIKSGDAVLFKRGDEFRLVDTMEREQAVSGSTTDTYAYIIAQAGVLYGAYGEGAKPKFNDSAYNYATQKTWEQVEGQDNIWVTDAMEVIIDNGDTKNPGRSAYKSTENGATNILFTKKGETEVEIGRRRSFTTADDIYTLHADGHFAFDQSTGKLYVYCTEGNPNEVFSSIEVSRGLTGLNLNAHCSGFVIDNLEFQGFGNGAIYGAYGNNDITVTNCEFGYSGGTMMGGDNDDTTEGETALRFGNAVGLWCGGSDFKVNYNWIYQTFDSAISPQGNTAISYNGFEVKGNLLEYNNCDIEIFDRGTATGVDASKAATWDDCDWSNNIMRFTTLGWGSREADKIRGIQGVIRGNFVDASLVKVDWTNNIIDSPGMEIAKLNNTTTYEIVDDVTTATGLFKLGQSFGTDKVSELGGNKYYINPAVRNGRLLFVDYKLDLTGDATMIYRASTADEFYSAISLFDTSVGSTSAVYYDGQLLENS